MFNDDDFDRIGPDSPESYFLYEQRRERQRIARDVLIEQISPVTYYELQRENAWQQEEREGERKRLARQNPSIFSRIWQWLSNYCHNKLHSKIMRSKRS
ncbi:MAG: hypothetical protein NTX00_02900 [Candidatus Parcubacteria bacterium]|nr:hypothetical protein [Candidatus Parcubacteria bacterium]